MGCILHVVSLIAGVNTSRTRFNCNSQGFIEKDIKVSYHIMIIMGYEIKNIKQSENASIKSTMKLLQVIPVNKIQTFVYLYLCMLSCKYYDKRNSKFNT